MAKRSTIRSSRISAAFLRPSFYLRRKRRKAALVICRVHGFSPSPTRSSNLRKSLLRPHPAKPLNSFSNSQLSIQRDVIGKLAPGLTGESLRLLGLHSTEVDPIQ